MKTIYTYIISGILFCNFTGYTSFAQEPDKNKDNLNRELTLEKEFTPMVRDASKVEEYPKVETLKVKRTEAKFSNWSTSLLPANVLQQLPAANYDTEHLFSNKKGYANLSMGNYWNISGNLGYQILNTEKNQLGIWMQHSSTNGKVKYNDYSQENDAPQYDGTGEKTPLKQINELVNLSYKHNFNKLSFYLDGAYQYRNFNYYGQNILPTPYLAQFPIDEYSSYNKNQIINKFSFKGGIISRIEDLVYYNASVRYNRYDNKLGLFYDINGATEDQITTAFEIASPFKNIYRVGLKAEMNNLIYHNSGFNNTIGEISGFNNLLYGINDYTMVALNPYFAIQKERLFLKLGIKSDITINQGTIVRLAPDIRLDWEFARSFFLFLEAKGGKQLNTFSRLAEESIYINPTTRVADSYIPIDASLGIRSNYFNGFYWEIYGGYKKIADDALQTSLGGGFINSPFGNNILFRNTISFLQAKTSNTYAGIQLKYKYDKIVETGLRFQKNSWKVSDQDFKILNRPDMEMTFDLMVRPIEKLSLNASYYMATGRNYLYGYFFTTPSDILTLAEATGKLKDIHSINLGADYQFNNWFNINVKLNNLLGRNYDLAYGLPAQGFNFLIGIGFKF